MSIALRYSHNLYLKTRINSRFVYTITTGVSKSKTGTAQPTLATAPKSNWSAVPGYWSSIQKVHLARYANMTTLNKLNFDNLALRSLPIDPSSERVSRSVPGACFSRVDPIPVKNPQVIAIANDVFELIDLDSAEFDSPDFAEYFGGNKILPGSEPAAHCYCGHQFGHFSGQLGDGAAMYLGEVVNKKGERWEIQLKGAGLTPYSRTADGRKVLRSTVREFLCSEAMHHLGISTTRAGTCVTSDSTVIRDIFYSGNPIKERCTLVLRVAPSFIRFGSFEIFKDTDPITGRKGPSVGRNDILTSLLQYVVKTFYPQIWSAHQGDEEKAYLSFFEEIVRRTACLVADWQCVGWCHGVLNTDNMSIVGATIDYGPFGFIDRYEPDFICNASDDRGRYTYAKQPNICKWNCLKLAEALSPIVPMDAMETILNGYDDIYEQYYNGKLLRKFGLLHTKQDGDKALFDAFFDALEQTGADFTNTFRALSSIPASDITDSDALQTSLDYILTQCCTLEEQKNAVAPRMNPRQLSMLVSLLQMNPDLISQLGADASTITAEFDRIEKTKQLQGQTQEEKSRRDTETWKNWLKRYGDRVKFELEAADDREQAAEERQTIMKSSNPRFILRNYIAQNAIDLAEKGDFSEVRRVLKLLQQPFSDNVDLGNLAEQGAEASASGSSCSFEHKYGNKPPEWAATLRVT